MASFTWSIGLVISNKDGMITDCAWGSPAFRAGIPEAAQVIAVNGLAYESTILEDAIRAAASTHEPIQLIIRNANRYQVASIEYTGGLRYPRLERDTTRPPLLDEILAARTR